MNKLDDTLLSSFQIAEQIEPLVAPSSSSTQIQAHPGQTQASPVHTEEHITLRTEVDKAMRRYFHQLEDEPVTDLYQMVISEVESPLLEAVMRYTGNNQSKASIMLGLNRGTLRTKLKQYGLL
jgi:Fis family transcriptional regulator